MTSHVNPAGVSSPARPGGMAMPGRPVPKYSPGFVPVAGGNGDTAANQKPLRLLPIVRKHHAHYIVVEWGTGRETVYMEEQRQFAVDRVQKSYKADGPKCARLYADHGKGRVLIGPVVEGEVFDFFGRVKQWDQMSMWASKLSKAVAQEDEGY